MVLKHYVDSLLALRFAELPSPLVDMGSGPGLPGIPLKIARPDVRMILAEPRGARADFLRMVCEKLGLEGVEVYANKVGPRFPYRVAGVITRAVATIPETLDRVAGCIEPGGKMIFMKGPDCDDEIHQARRSHAELFRLETDRAYAIPGTSHARRLVIYERTAAEAPSIGEPAPEKGTAVAVAAYAGPLREVSSASNPAFRLYRDLLTGRGIRKHGQAILAGSRIVAEVLARFPDRAVAWLTDANGPPPPAEAPSGVVWLKLSDDLFRELDTAGTHGPLLVVSVPSIPDFSASAPWPDGCSLFVPFQNPDNVGAPDPLGGGLRRLADRPAPRGRPPVPSQGRPRRRHRAFPGPVGAGALDRRPRPVDRAADRALGGRARPRLRALPGSVRPGPGARRARPAGGPEEGADPEDTDRRGCGIAQRGGGDGGGLV